MVLQAGVLMNADTMQDRVKAVARLQSLINAYSGAVFIKQRAAIRFNIVEFFLAHDAALQERIDELEAQLFITRADAALPLFDAMGLEPMPAFPSIRAA